MVNENAYSLLFKYDFGGGCLFKNQGDLAIELINNQDSSYYVAQSEESYIKKLGNLKVYVSQLFSDTTRRTVTPAFKESLQILLEKKIPNNYSEKKTAISSILDDLIKRNTIQAIQLNKERELDGVLFDFFSKLSHSDYLAIFSAREINFEKSMSFTDLLLDGLIKSLREGGHNKWYRFNFPTTQTCYLFWIGFKKEITKYLRINNTFLPLVISQLFSNNIISFNSSNELGDYSSIENRIAAEVLGYLSKNRIISVFHLSAPVYLLPFVAINPNDRNTRTVYSIYQSDNGYDRVHKFTKDEIFHWGYFVWDNLRFNEFGKPIEYSDSFAD